MLPEINFIDFNILNKALFVSDFWNLSTFVKDWFLHLILSNKYNHMKVSEEKIWE